MEIISQDNHGLTDAQIARMFYMEELESASKERQERAERRQREVDDALMARHLQQQINEEDRRIQLAQQALRQNSQQETHRSVSNIPLPSQRPISNSSAPVRSSQTLEHHTHHPLSSNMISHREINSPTLSSSERLMNLFQNGLNKDSQADDNFFHFGSSSSPIRDHTPVTIDSDSNSVTSEQRCRSSNSSKISKHQYTHFLLSRI